MAVITYEVATDIVMSNITVERKYADGVQTAYRLTANSGYVMYDTTANNFEPLLDENGNIIYDENGNIVETSVNYYYRQVTYPVRNDPSTWQNDWIAVPETSVDENYIFGSGNNHEVI